MKTVEKTLAIMEAFLDHPQEEEIGIMALADLTGLNVSTIHRISSMLVKRGYLSQKQSRAKYALGPKFLRFGSLASSRMGIGALAFPYLVQLSRSVGEAVNLAIQHSAEAVYIQCVSPSEPAYQLRTFAQVGARVPLYCTGVGKVLLSHMPEEECEQYLTETSFTRRTPNTIADCTLLKEELATIRRCGYAVDNEEMELGVKCIAAPIRNFKGEVVTAVSISGPSIRLTEEKIQQLEPLVKDCAFDISRAAGYGAPEEATTSGRFGHRENRSRRIR